MTTQHLEIISKLKIYQWNKILLIHHPKIKLTSDMYYNYFNETLSYLKMQISQGSGAINLRWGGYWCMNHIFHCLFFLPLKGLYPIFPCGYPKNVWRPF